MGSNRGRYRAATAGLALALLVGTGACSSIGRDDTASGSDTATGSDASIVAQEEGEAAGDGVFATSNALAATAAGGGGSAGSASPEQTRALGGGPLPASVSQPKIVKTATLHVEVGDGTFSRAFSEAATIASGVGGFVASSTSAAGGGDDPAAGSLTLRVPAERFDEVRERLGKLGDLRSEELRGDDVGGQIADIEARLRNLRAQEEAIRALMSRTKDVPETLQVQNQLSAVREQIEQLDGQRARLDDAVTFATLTVQLNEPGATPAGERSRLGEAVHNALDGAAAVLAGAIVALGYLVPLAVLALVAYTVVRLAVRRRQVALVASAEHGS